MRGTLPDDARHLDLGASKLDPHDLHQADELIGIPRADLCPRQPLGRDGHELFGGVHASIFPGGRRLSSFLQSGGADPYSVSWKILGRAGGVVTERDPRGGRCDCCHVLGRAPAFVRRVPIPPLGGTSAMHHRAHEAR